MDFARLNELRDEVGEDALDEVLEMFLEETDDIAARLAAGIPSSEMCAAMHFMKGAALNIGFDELAGLCQTAETQAGRNPDAEIDIAAILSCYAASKEELKLYGSQTVTAA